MTRRPFFLARLASGLLSAVGLGIYATLIEPDRVAVTRYAPQLPHWPEDYPLRIVMISDLHATEPWTGAERIAAICERANALKPDIILLLGDYECGPRWGRDLPADVWAGLLGVLKAPLGVHAVLGNHDYPIDGHSSFQQGGKTDAEAALTAVGIAVYINRSVRIVHQGRGFWLAGLGVQTAFARRGTDGRWRRYGVDDLEATLAQVTTDEPVLMMAHEPDIFDVSPSRVALTMSGHTHGGQVKLFGYAPVVPSRFGNRYVHGHIVENDRHLIVGAGLGMSGLPIRFGAPPEIVMIELGGAR